MQKQIKCGVEGCNHTLVSKTGTKYLLLGYCNKHYRRFKVHGDPEIVLIVNKSGNAKHPLYQTWSGIANRTSNQNEPDYPRYGGRGIKMCERWKGPNGFRNFVQDMGERPENHTLDRRDNDGDYSKENCRWATPHQQTANRRSSNKVVGVFWFKQNSKWVAQIMVDRKQKYLGSFTEYEDAVSARKAAEVLYGINI